MSTLSRWFERIPQALGWHRLLCACGLHDYAPVDDEDCDKCRDCGEYDFWYDI